MSRRMSGYTLVEMTMSIAIVSILCLTVGSLMMVAARASNTALNGTAAQLAAVRGPADQVADDLAVALTIPEQTATAVTVTVPNRSGGSSAQTVRYAWAGNGAPLTKSFSGSQAVSIADSVQSFALSYLTRTVGQTVTPITSVESAWQTLASRDNTATATLSTTSITSTNWMAQYFKPSLPADATSWHITHLKLYLVENTLGSLSTLTVQVQSVNAAYAPSGTVLDKASLAALSLPLLSPGWVDVSFSNLSGLSPSQGVAIVVGSVNSTAPGKLYYETGVSTASANMLSATSANLGSSWTTPSGTSVAEFYVYGTITYP